MEPKHPYTSRNKIDTPSTSIRLREPFHSLTGRSERSPLISNNIRNRRQASRLKTAKLPKTSRTLKGSKTFRERTAYRGTSALYTSRDRPTNFMASLRQIKMDKKKDRSANLDRGGMKRSQGGWCGIGGVRGLKKSLNGSKFLFNHRIGENKKNKSQISQRFDLISYFIAVYIMVW